MTWRAGESFANYQDRIRANFDRLEARTHYLYRAWDVDGRLLYIGCTVNLPQRMNAHRKSAEWWFWVASLTVENFPTRSEARAAEEAAIDAEASFFNRIAGGNQFGSRTPAGRGLVAYCAARDAAYCAARDAAA